MAPCAEQRGPTWTIPVSTHLTLIAPPIACRQPAAKRESFVRVITHHSNANHGYNAKTNHVYVSGLLDQTPFHVARILHVAVYIPLVNAYKKTSISTFRIRPRLRQSKRGIFRLLTRMSRTSRASAASDMKLDWTMSCEKSNPAMDPSSSQTQQVK